MNTSVTIQFDSGETRKFVASDKLEKLIKDGDMIGFTTIHPNTGHEIAKMYAGNPMAALGQMMMMRRNADNMRSSKSNRIIKEVLTACITMLSNEITSHDSGISPIEDDGTGERSYYNG